MTTGARTPEELEALLEDAFVVHDPAAAAGLFEQGAVSSRRTSRGRRGVRQRSPSWSRRCGGTA